MKIIFFFFLILFFTNCSKPKTVLICGDHKCINKSEAEQYFEENLSIEVRIIDKKITNEFNLVELNLKKDIKGNRKVNVIKKESSIGDMKILSKKEIIEIKSKIKSKNIQTKNIEKVLKKEKVMREKISIKENNLKSISKREVITKNPIKKIEAVDVCSILDKCSIDEISKYILSEAKKKDFPDITMQE